MTSGEQEVDVTFINRECLRVRASPPTTFFVAEDGGQVVDMPQ